MIDKLEFFIALAQERHFGRAADLCGITQPTLSAAIKQLEDQLGVMLVNRGSRYQSLTPEGQRVLEWARRIVGDSRTMHEEMRAARRGLVGHIRLAAVPTTLAMVPRITAPFQEKHPDVTFSILSTTSLKILGLLENLEIDAGLTYLENEPLGTRYQRAAAGGALSSGDRCRFPALGSRNRDVERSWRYSALSIDRRYAEPAHHQSALRRGRRDRLADAGINSMIVLFSHVRTGHWASIMPYNVAKSFGFHEDIKLIPIIEPDARHTVGLVATHREPYTPLVSALLHEARILADAQAL